MKKDIINDYFEWLCNKIYVDNEHNKLLKVLFDVKFRWIIADDENRAKDGKWLRNNYCQSRNIGSNNLDILGECRILELMIALSERIEDDTMYDPDCGDRTSFWFWAMVRNLGLIDIFDDCFNEDLVRYKLDIFMDRRFKDNGEGSLFSVPKHTSKIRQKVVGTSKKMVNMSIHEAKEFWISENFE